MQHNARIFSVNYTDIISNIIDLLVVLMHNSVREVRLALQKTQTKMQIRYVNVQQTHTYIQSNS
jgi:hypothetical protein